ncbi:MAG TPA: pirin-like C-terminal cupin domain-containing protein, partial [Bacteriovoracaceae bacterium]|nr:pirin-like C-terminal cupin domain-containing protein [Bacteriovoracaceae bacterium]
ISHSEREPQEVRAYERTLHGLQFWIALPLEHEDDEPSFRHYTKEEIPVIENESLKMTVIAGSAAGKTSEVKTLSPTTFLVLTSHRTGTFSFNHLQGQEHAVYLVKGSLKLGDQIINEHEMAVFDMNSDIEVEYEADSVFAIIGGEPFPEPRYIFWNFVSSSKEKIEVAKKAWRDRSFPQVPGESDFIPLPDDRPTVVDYP